MTLNAEGDIFIKLKSPAYCTIWYAVQCVVCDLGVRSQCVKCEHSRTEEVMGMAFGEGTLVCSSRTHSGHLAVLWTS